MFKTETVNYGGGIYAFDQGMVRAFLILGKERALLFDTGIEPFDLKSAIGEITPLPVILYLSHSDIDHIGGIGEFDTIYVHEAEVKRLMAAEKTEKSNIIPLKEGFEFDLGERRLELIHCPGHTPGSGALLDSKNKLLFSGDTISYGPVYMFGEGRDDSEYLRTLGRLLNMYKDKRFEKVYPCHNTCPIDGGVTEDLIKCMEEIRERPENRIKTPIKKLPQGKAKKPCLRQFFCSVGVRS